MMRSLILVAVLSLTTMSVAACGENSTSLAQTPDLNVKLLDKEVTLLAERARPGRLEVAVQNLESGQMWARNAVQFFPMQSVFKAPLGAAVLAEVDAGKLSLDEVITLDDMDMSPPLSPIAQAWPDRRRYTVRELLKAAVSDSDNTAADVLMRRIGGPGALTAWLGSKGLSGIRIERYERELQPDTLGMPSFRSDWRTPEAFRAAALAVPEADRRIAWQRYMTDPRDTIIASGALNFLRMLQTGELLKPSSRALLLQLMTETSTGPNRLKAGLPDGASLAHKTGTSGTHFGVTVATNDMGILTLKDGRQYAVAVFLADSPASQTEREAIIAEAMRIVARSVD